jgi:hypothetical protein
MKQARLSYKSGLLQTKIKIYNDKLLLKFGLNLPDGLLYAREM